MLHRRGAKQKPPGGSNTMFWSSSKELEGKGFCAPYGRVGAGGNPLAEIGLRPWRASVLRLR